MTLFKSYRPVLRIVSNVIRSSLVYCPGDDSLPVSPRPTRLQDPDPFGGSLFPYDPKIPRKNKRRVDLGPVRDPNRRRRREVGFTTKTTLTQSLPPRSW